MYTDMYVYIYIYVYVRVLPCVELRTLPLPRFASCICCSRPCAMLLKSVNASQAQAKSAFRCSRVPVPLKP